MGFYNGELDIHILLGMYFISPNQHLFIVPKSSVDPHTYTRICMSSALMCFNYDFVYVFFCGLDFDINIRLTLYIWREIRFIFFCISPNCYL